MSTVQNTACSSSSGIRSNHTQDTMTTCGEPYGICLHCKQSIMLVDGVWVDHCFAGSLVSKPDHKVIKESSTREYDEVCKIAMIIFKRTFAKKRDFIQIELLDDILGVTSQIDNMLCGIDMKLTEGVS